MNSAAPTTMTKFRLFWEAADAVLERRGLPSLSYETARRWFESELEPEDVPEVIISPQPTSERGS